MLVLDTVYNLRHIKLPNFDTSYIVISNFRCIVSNALCPPPPDINLCRNRNLDQHHCRRRRKQRKHFVVIVTVLCVLPEKKQRASSHNSSTNSIGSSNTNNPQQKQHQQQQKYTLGFAPPPLPPPHLPQVSRRAVKVCTARELKSSRQDFRHWNAMIGGATCGVWLLDVPFY